MKLKLIGLCSFFIFCLTLKGRKVGASVLYAKLVESTLNLINFKSPLEDPKQWEKAFVFLSTEYIVMKMNLSNALNDLSNDYEIMKMNLTNALNDLSKDYRIMKMNLTNALNDLSKDYGIMKMNLTNALNDLSKDYGIMKTNLTNECNHWKEEYLKVASVEFTRRILEDGDLTLTYGGFAFPTIADMKKKLQKEKGQLDETAVSEAKNLGEHESKRRLRWLYYMTYAETTFAEELRKLLRTWKISAFTLSGFFDRVYSISSGKMHSFSVKGLDAKAAEAGFQMYGVVDRGLLDCLRIIFEIPKLTGFNPPTTIPVPDEVEQTNEVHEQKVSTDLLNAKN